MTNNHAKRYIYLSLLGILITGCVTRVHHPITRTHHPNYYKVSLKFKTKNMFHYRILHSNTYCPAKDEKGRHIKDKDGYKYENVCSDANGDKLYSTKEEAISSLSKTIKEDCEKQSLKHELLGQKDTKEFLFAVGMPINPGLAVGVPIDPGLAVGVPFFDKTIDLYYSCVPK